MFAAVGDCLSDSHLGIKLALSSDCSAKLKVAYIDVIGRVCIHIIVRERCSCI